MRSSEDPYVAGEEVVVRLARARVFDPRRGSVLDAVALPPWTIGRILHSSTGDGSSSYVIAFSHRQASYFCAVGAGSIEGTA